MRALRHLDEADLLKLIKGAAGCSKVRNAHPMCCIPNAEIQAAVVLAVVQHHEFDQQRAGIRVEAAIGVAGKDPMVQPDEAAGVAPTGCIWFAAPVTPSRHARALRIPGSLQDGRKVRGSWRLPLDDRSLRL